MLIITMALTANKLGHQALDEIQRFHQAFRGAFYRIKRCPQPHCPRARWEARTFVCR